MSDNINYDKLARERFTKTKIYDYDQITAIPERAINYQLRQMYKLSKPDAPLKKLVTDLVPDDDWTQIIANMGAPKIQLKLGVAKQTVIYTMTLESGVYRYWKGRGRSSTQQKADIENWTLAFRVNLDWDALDENDIPDHVKKVLKNPEDFSVHQLLVDFTTADVTHYIEKDSHIGLDKSQAIEFTVYLNEYLQKLAADTISGHSTIHYLPKIKDPKKYHAPTLAPTSLNFQSLPFVVSAGDEGKEGSDDNMLIYLQTTMNKPLPRDLLPISANWVIPPSDPLKPRYDGTVCISRQRFLDGWLLPKLRDVNRQTSWLSTRASWAPFTNTPWTMDGHVGLKDDEEPDKGDWVFDQENSNVDCRKYTYSLQSHKDCNDGSESLSVASIAGSTGNKLEIPCGLNEDGKCVVTLSGEVQVNIIIHLLKGVSYTVARYTMTWTADITLDGVDHGKLQIKANVTVNPIVAEPPNQFWQIFQGIENFGVHIEDQMRKLSLDNLKQDMERVLGGSWEFIFSGSDDFFFDKTGFNSEGDLLAQLKYQGGL